MQAIRTKRLLLREWQDNDLQAFSLINQDPLVMAHMPNLLTLEETKAFISKMSAHYAAHGFGPMALTLSSSGELIGYVGLKHIEFQADFTPAIEIAWRVASQHWNQGYATEAAQAILEFGFQSLGLNEIVSMTVPANTGSIRVMEKIGMERDLKADFAHPALPKDHKLSLHVLYRIKK